MTIPRPVPALVCVGYVRVSTEDQARDDRTSLADQRLAITALAQRLGGTLERWFDDPGVSGASADQRPGFTALLAYCRDHPQPARSPGYVLVLNDSRWGRFPDPEESTYHRFECKKRGWIVRFAEGDDVQDPMARILLRGIHSAQASAYREALRANTKRGTRGAAAQGFWLNEAPFGYRRLAQAPGRAAMVLELGQRKADDQKVRLTPGPAAEQDAVRWAFSAYAAGGISLGGIARELRRRDPVRKWSKTNAGKVLKNRAYLGEVIWCRRPHDPDERRERAIRPESEWVVVPDAHPALVTPALFDAVQARLAGNRKATRATAGGYPLSGLIRCAECGHPYTGGGGPKGPAEDTDRYRFYKDRGGTEEYRACAGFLGTLQKRWVEPVVINVIASIVRQPVVQRQLAAALERRLVVGETGDPDRRRLAAERDEVRTARQRLVVAISRGVLQEAEAGPELERLRQEEARVSAAIEQQRFAGRRTDRLETERARLMALATDFEARARQLTGAALRELLAPWIESAVVDKHKRQLRLTIRRVPGVTTFLHSATAGGPSGQKQKLRLFETRVIPLPKTAWVAKRRRTGT